jgi:hypothetical protein
VRFERSAIAPEPFGQHLIGLGLGRAAPGRRSPHGSEGQPTAWHPRQLRRQESCRQLIYVLAMTGCLSGQRLRNGAIQVQRYCHISSVNSPCTRAGTTAAATGAEERLLTK